MEIGTRVRLLGQRYNIPKGATGTVLDSTDIPFVEWDKAILDGHDAYNLCGKLGHCWAVVVGDLEIISETNTLTNRSLPSSTLKGRLKAIREKNG